MYQTGQFRVILDHRNQRLRIDQNDYPPGWLPSFSPLATFTQAEEFYNHELEDGRPLVEAIDQQDRKCEGILEAIKWFWHEVEENRKVVC